MLLQRADLGLRLRPWNLPAVFAATLAGALLVTAPPALAQAIEVVPVRIELPAGRRATTVAVTNHGSTTTGIQARAFLWNQADNADQLTATQDILLSPPITELPPGETQLIRIVLRRSAEHREATYRLLVDQIPPADSQANGVRIALRLSLPIFVRPAEKVASQLDWRVVSADGIAAELIAVNRGTRHARLTEVSVAGPGGTSLSMPGGGGPYVLPGAERRWKLSGKVSGLKTGTVLKLRAATDEGRIEAAPVFALAP